jgi:hypothetical protein
VNDVLDAILQNSTRDELEDLCGILLGVLGRIEIQRNNWSMEKMQSIRVAEENAKLKADIDGLRKIIDNERAAAEGR